MLSYYYYPTKGNVHSPTTKCLRCDRASRACACHSQRPRPPAYLFGVAQHEDMSQASQPANSIDVTLPTGSRLYSASYSSLANGVDGRLLRLLNAFASPERDIYQFGVFTGVGLKKIADSVKNCGHLWGFDSFQGIPEESAGEHESWRGTGAHSHFGRGGYSAAHALGTTSLRTAMSKVAGIVGHQERVSLIPGFFNESLNQRLLRTSKLQPALHVDMDADIYLSAAQALDWMFANRLLVPGSFLRYDDWPRFNASFGPAAGTNLFGQARAHYEISVKYDVRWKLVAKGAVQVLSVGGRTCEPEVCDRAKPLRDIFVTNKHSGRDGRGVGIQDPALLPIWGVEREGLS